MRSAAKNTVDDPHKGPVARIEGGGTIAITTSALRQIRNGMSVLSSGVLARKNPAITIVIDTIQ
jgi:hypothetical protein